jgi:histidyl-tRNA synthetase
LLLSVGDVELPREEIDCFFVVGEGADRAQVLATMAQLRARGLACDTDYAGRSKKGQLTQAARLGARTTVIVDADGMRILKPGGDEPTTRDELVATLAA